MNQKTKQSAMSPRTLFFLVCCTALLTVAAFQIKSDTDPHRDLRDFGSFWGSGHAANQGRNPYAVQPETLRFILNGTVQLDPNLNVPALLPIFQIAALVPPLTGKHLATAFTALAAIACAALLFFAGGNSLQKRQIVWILFAAAVLNTLNDGQDYALLLLLSTAAWWLESEEHYDLYAICIGLIATAKPNILVWPALLILSGQRRRGLIAVATFMAMSLMPIVIYGPSIYRQWLEAFSLADHSIFPRNVSLVAFFTRIGVRPAGELVAASLLAWCAWLAWKKRLNRENLPIVAICAAILCSPLAWFDYSMMLVPWVVARRWSAAETLAGAALMIPAHWIDRGLYSTNLSLVIASCPYVYALLMFLFGTIFCAAQDGS